MTNNFKCSGCNEVFYLPAIEARYSDLPPAIPQINLSTEQSNIKARPVDGHFWTLLMREVWCLHCDARSFVEDFPSREEWYKAVGARRLPKKARRDIHDDLISLKEDDFLLAMEHSLARSTPPKCLVCAGSHFIYTENMYGDSGLKHQACWDSPIIALGFSIGGGVYCRSNEYMVRVYNPQGELSWIAAFFYDRAKQRDLEFTLYVGNFGNVGKAGANPGAEHARYQQIIFAIEGGEFAKALALLQPLLDAQFGPALGLLGVLHAAGRGVEQDGAKAIDLLQQAIKAGDAVSAHNLARLYYSGAQGITQDLALAQHWFRLALRSGAQFAEASFYDEVFAASTSTS